MEKQIPGNSSNTSDRVTQIVRWSIWTPLCGWLMLVPFPYVAIIPVTLACALVAACLILFFPTVGAARQANREGRRKAFVGGLIGSILCGLTGFGGLAILIIDGSKSAGPWRDASSIGPYLVALFLCSLYFIPLFRTLLNRPAVSLGFLAVSLTVLLLALAAPLPFVTDTWTRLFEPDLWRAREKQRSYSDFIKEHGYRGNITAHPTFSAELWIPGGKTLDGPAVAWLAKHHPGVALTLRVDADAQVDLAALEILPALDVRICSYHPADPNGTFLEAITQCPNLEELNCYGFSPEGMSLQPLIAADKLRRLKVWNIARTDADLEILASLSKLESIQLSGSNRLTDEGLRHLAGLKQLRRLEVSSHRIQGPGLRYLHGLENLEKFQLRGFKEVDPSSIEELKLALPRCVIIIEP